MSNDCDALPPIPRVVGMGHPFRCDDGVGPWMAEQLAARGCAAVTMAGDGAALMDLFDPDVAMLVIDAMQSGQPPGSVRLFDAGAAPLEACFRNSTHEFGLTAAIETARALGTLPASLWVLGIEGVEFGFGETLSPPVRAAAEALLPVLADRLGTQETGATSDAAPVRFR